jgi:leucine dehydrogenase
MMDPYSHQEWRGHEQLSLFWNEKAKLRAIDAIHSSRIGPAIGGCRMWPYSTVEEAITDALRLAKGMTYKSAMADLPPAGAKMVIIGDPRRDKTPELLRAIARAINSFNGRHIGGEDVGMEASDIEYMSHFSPWILGVKSGDPSPVTARGVWWGIRAAVRRKLGRFDLEGVRVAIQGQGHVGHPLARMLHEDGARLVVADLDSSRTARAADEFGARVVSTEAILTVETDVFAPCALGAVINDDTVGDLQCAIVAGSANNQLLGVRHGFELHKRGILYAPDYVINAGGLINIAQERAIGGYNLTDALQRVSRIEDTLEEIFERSLLSGNPPSDIADCMAEERITLANKEIAAYEDRLARSIPKDAPRATTTVSHQSGGALNAVL